MLCISCRGEGRDVSAAPAVLGNDSNGPAPERRQFCDRCGSLIIDPGVVDAAGRTLAQLEKFGLAGEAQPVLEPKCSGPAGSTREK